MDESTAKEYIISDNEKTIIDRKEISAKIERIEVYLRRIQMRLNNISEKKEEIHSEGAQKQLIKRGLTLLNLQNRVKKEV